MTRDAKIGYAVQGAVYAAAIASAACGERLSADEIGPKVLARAGYYL